MSDIDRRHVTYPSLPHLHPHENLARSVSLSSPTFRSPCPRIRTPHTQKNVFFPDSSPYLSHFLFRPRPPGQTSHPIPHHTICPSPSASTFLFVRMRLLSFTASSVSQRKVFRSRNLTGGKTEHRCVAFFF